MRQFWTLLALGATEILVGTIGMSAAGQVPRETAIEVSAPAAAADVAPWVHL